VIVGAGIIGLSIGWRAGELGLSVAVLDGTPAPSGASWVAAGMLAPVTEVVFGEEALLRTNISAVKRWPAFAADLCEATGLDLGAGPQGTIFAALDRDQAEALRRLHDYQLSLGLQAEWLDGETIRDLEPSLHPSTVGGVLVANDTAVDPRKVIAALIAALKNLGSPARFGAGVVGISGGREPYVLLEDGERIAARSVVVAAGSRSGLIEGIPQSVRRAIRPVKGQILRLRSGPAALMSHIIRTEEVYLVPRPAGEVVVGATVEEKGFDTSLTAGGLLELLRAADETVPGIREMQVVETAAGLRPATPDNMPLIGPTELEGVIVAAGHYRNGILQAPFTAAGVAELLVKGETPRQLSAFDPGRFGH
jgi:glycine oxidase